MEIVVTGRHMQVSDRFRDHLDEKLAKIPQLAPRVQRVDVIVSHEPNKRQAKACERVEITCHVKGPVVRAEACLDDKYAALDVAMDKLMERLSRAQDRKRGAPRAARARVGGRRPRRASSAALNGVGEAGAEAAEGEEVDVFGAQGNSPVEVREKVHATVPMALDQAVREMELVGPRLLPLPRRGDRPAERGLPPPRLVLRRDPPRRRPTEAPSTRTRCSGARAAREAVGSQRWRSQLTPAERRRRPDLRTWAGAAARRDTMSTVTAGDDGAGVGRAHPGRHRRRPRPLPPRPADGRARRTTTSTSSARPGTARRRSTAPSSCCPTWCSWTCGCRARRASRPA